ncbi:MAG: transcriptional repressor [Coprobacter sp.]|nr:transcriptional repressor [Coprobacter sp.]
MTTDQYAEKLQQKGIKPTAARIIVYKELSGQKNPVSLLELERLTDTLDKSTISRTLSVLLEHHAIHAFEDGSGSTKYEICTSGNSCPIQNRHIHFFCEKCRQTVCLDNIHIPVVQLPQGYVMESVNYTVKGICPSCNRS